ncbi:TetR/AcrR family transcriptional regulator [Streptomyces sp. ODS28]|uniref:TetR/AcrR family transcriptional regulator n=1 Tax=Streptomyces sp. ODS28 TaxID=3136688 RepID=UPI0031ED84A9
MSATPRREATTARRDQIIRAAVGLLAERGYQATTFDAICRRAGLSSKRLITYHFSGKEELYAAIAGQVVAEAEEFTRPALDEAEGARATLSAFIRANVRFMADHLAQMRALQQLIVNGGEAWAQPHAEALDRLTGLFAEGSRTGEFRPCDPRVTATALRAALDGMYEPLAAGAEPDACAGELAELFDRAVRPD